jgi:hypothetical protein
MEIYDPNRAIDPLEWNNLDENERQYLVERFHQEKRIFGDKIIIENLGEFVCEDRVDRMAERFREEGMGDALQ